MSSLSASCSTGAVETVARHIAPSRKKQSEAAVDTMADDRQLNCWLSNSS